ncbi:MAG: CDP-alcohol phosphatidyltransferase family protein [Acidobacteria bacterium]|nr:CDP-alcohol phosphatidyltransferase family protein [Acidobacteriota bacterium]
MTSPLAGFHRANTLTYVSLLCAIGAIAGAVHGRGSVAGALIAAAVIADTFDGKFARSFKRTGTERALGAQLDSLSDAIAFGAAPCVCMMLIGPSRPGWAELAWWAGFAAFSICAITRLAFYNVSTDAASGFVGLPVPVAALIWSTAVLVSPAPLTSSLLLLATAGAMVLPMRIPRPAGLALAAFVIWPLLVIAAFALRGA